MLARDDKSINPEIQRKMYQRSGTTVTEIQGSHSLIQRPWPTSSNPPRRAQGESCSVALLLCAIARPNQSQARALYSNYYKTTPVYGQTQTISETEALQQALQVFWQKGYAATSVVELQAAMNLNAPSLYATFGDKRRLFLRALRSYQYKQEAALQQVLGGKEPVKTRIRLLLQGRIVAGDRRPT